MGWITKGVNIFLRSIVAVIALSTPVIVLPTLPMMPVACASTATATSSQGATRSIRWPAQQARSLEQIEPYGMMIALMMALSGLLYNILMRPLEEAAMWLTGLLVGL